MSKKLNRDEMRARAADRKLARQIEQYDRDPFRKNMKVKCTICGETPTVGDTGLCGPHCFGEAATLGGEW